MVGDQKPTKPTGPLYLAEWLEHFDISAEDLAQMLRVTQPTVWRWCNGERHPNPIMQARIARALKIWPGQLWLDPKDKVSRMVSAIVENETPAIKPYSSKKQ